MEPFFDYLNYPIISTGDINLTLSKVLIVLFIFIAAFLGMRILHRLFMRLASGLNMDTGTSNSLFQIVRYVVWVLMVVIALDTIGIEVSILLASVAALLVGVGLGLQQLFNDVSSGVIMLIERNLKITDVIQMEDGTVGKVIEIGLRTSKIKTRDDIIMIVPNSRFVNDQIINWSHSDENTRFHVDVGVAYGSDVQLVKKILLDCANTNKEIIHSPKPFVRFNDFGNSSLDFQLYFWVRNSFLVENIKSDIRFAIDAGFRENSIEIPFPQRDLHIKSDFRHSAG